MMFTMFKAVELPAGVSDLATSLTNVDRNAFPLNNFIIKVKLIIAGQAIQVRELLRIIKRAFYFILYLQYCILLGIKSQNMIVCMKYIIRILDNTNLLYIYIKLPLYFSHFYILSYI